MPNSNARIKHSTSFFKILNWERYFPYESRIAFVGTIFITGAFLNICSSVLENQAKKRKGAKAPGEG
jgi:hypothetical protein